MIKTDEDALICDLAETYHIYDYRQLPPTNVAVFSCGLKEESRIKMKLSGQTVTFERLMMAKATDLLSVLVWTKSKDAEKGKNYPKQILNSLLGIEEPKNDSILSFSSSEEFERRRNELIGGE